MVFNAVNIQRGRGPAHGAGEGHRDNPESRAQQALINRVRNSRAIMPELKFFHSCPNSTKTSMSIAGRMKAEGVERGAFDLFWDLAHGGWHGLRIEMKAEYPPDTPGHAARRGTLSEEQKGFAAFYAGQGHLAVSCFDERQAWTLIEWYYSLPPTPVAPRTPLPASLACCAAQMVHRPQSPETRVKRQETFAARRAARFGSSHAPAGSGHVPTEPLQSGPVKPNPVKYPVKG